MTLCLNSKSEILNSKQMSKNSLRAKVRMLDKTKIQLPSRLEARSRDVNPNLITITHRLLGFRISCLVF